jgi:hypothetical protein
MALKLNCRGDGPVDAVFLSQGTPRWGLPLVYEATPDNTNAGLFGYFLT